MRSDFLLVFMQNLVSGLLRGIARNPFLLTKIKEVCPAKNYIASHATEHIYPIRRLNIQPEGLIGL